MRKPLTLALAALAFAASAFAIGEARITGKVLDAATKKPIENATITVTATEGKTFKQNYPAKKDGTYAIFLLDGTLHEDSGDFAKVNLSGPFVGASFRF